MNWNRFLTLFFALILLSPAFAVAQNDADSGRVQPPPKSKSSSSKPSQKASTKAPQRGDTLDVPGANAKREPKGGAKVSDSIPAKPPIEFKTWYPTHKEAYQIAVQSKRQVLLVFETEWCQWCKAMNETTWTDDGVLKMAKGIILTRVDGDLDTAMVNKYHVRRYPTMILTSDQGIESERLVGYFEPRDFVERLTSAIEGQGTIADLDRQLSESKNDTKLMMKLSRKYIERGEYERAIEYLQRAKSMDIDGNLGVLDDVLFVTAQIEREKKNWYKSLEGLKQMVKKYPESEWREDAELYIPWLLTQTGDRKEALRRYNEFLKDHGGSSEVPWVKRHIAELELAEAAAEAKAKATTSESKGQ